MAIDINRMGSFEACNGVGDGIVNLQSGAYNHANSIRLTTNGKYHRFNVLRGIRSQKEIDANRSVRETLLENLRATFSLKNDADYMDKLKRILGNDILKSEDFGADAQGKVHTNRPLTERRISAIVKRVRELADASWPQKICRAAMTEKCIDEFVAGVKAGKLGTATALTKFIGRHFGGELGRRLEGAMAVPGADRDALCRQVAAEMLKSLRTALVNGGVTRSQLQTVMDAVKTFPEVATPMADDLPSRLARSFLSELTPAVADNIARKSLDLWLANQFVKLSNVTWSEWQGSFAKLMNTDRGRDILLRTAIDGFKHLPMIQPNSPGESPLRQKLDKLLLDLAGQVKRLGSERANLFVKEVCEMASVKNGHGLLHMQQRQLLGTVLKQYADLADADLRQFTLAQLQDFARAAVDDSLASDRETILGEMKRFAKSMRSQNYTDAETRELIEFSHELEGFKPVQGVEQKHRSGVSSAALNGAFEAGGQANPRVDKICATLAVLCAHGDRHEGAFVP